MPSAFRVDTDSNICSTSFGASPSDGSSSISSFGRAIRARPMASICRSPPLSVLAFWLLRSSRIGYRASTASRSDWMPSLSRRQKAPASRFSRTVMFSSSIRPSGTWISPDCVMSCGSVPLSSWPSKRIVPRVGLSSPEIVRRVVDFPAPLAPIRVTIWPASTLRETPRSACTSP